MKKGLVLVALLVILAAGCSRKSEDASKKNGGGGVLPGGGSSLPVSLGTTAGDTLPKNRDFNAGAMNFPGTDNIYAIGLGLTPLTGSLERFVLIARELYADASLGPVGQWIHGTNTSLDYTPGGSGWDFAWYSGDTGANQFRILSGIS